MSEPEVLLSRHENYSCEVPDQAKVIVAAIDTQVSWFEYLVVAGRARGEIWCLETGTIEGRFQNPPLIPPGDEPQSPPPMLLSR